MTRELVALVEQLDEARAHVLASVDGLDEEQLTSVHAPVGWSISQLLNHLTSRTRSSGAERSWAEITSASCW